MSAPLSLACGFSLGVGVGAENMCLMFWLFGGLPDGLVTVLPDSECWWNWHSLDAQWQGMGKWGVAESKGKWGQLAAAWELLQCPRKRLLWLGTTCYSSLKREGEKWREKHVSSFSENCPGDWYLCCPIWGAYRELANFGCQRATENKERRESCSSTIREPAVPQTPDSTRDYNRLTSLIGKSHTHKPREII